MTRDEVKEVFKVLANVYPQFEVTSEKLDIWTKFLKDQNPAKVMKNAERHVLEHKFAPTIADLREVYHPAYHTNIAGQIKQWEAEASVKE